MEQNNNPLDEHIIAQFSPKQIQTYFSLYFKNARELVKQLHTAAEQDNFDHLQQRAHKLKGSSTVVGASAIKRIAHDIEMDAKQHADVAPERVDDLEQRLKELNELINNRYNLNL